MFVMVKVILGIYDKLVGEISSYLVDGPFLSIVKPNLKYTVNNQVNINGNRRQYSTACSL